MKHKEPTQPPLNSKVQVKNCKECEKTFGKNSDLETHVVAEHGHEKAFGCEICGKLFVLEWRMKKHLVMHDEETTICKFFANQQDCPFEEIGCKFRHGPSENYNNNEDITNVSDDDNDDSYEFVENQCHLCKLQLLNRDDLYQHIETNHEDYHQGMLELIANRKNII